MSAAAVPTGPDGCWGPGCPVTLHPAAVTTTAGFVTSGSPVGQVAAARELWLSCAALLCSHYGHTGISGSLVSPQHRTALVPKEMKRPTRYPKAPPVPMRPCDPGRAGHSLCPSAAHIPPLHSAASASAAPAAGAGGLLHPPDCVPQQPQARPAPRALPHCEAAHTPGLGGIKAIT